MLLQNSTNINANGVNGNIASGNQGNISNSATNQNTQPTNSNSQQPSNPSSNNVNHPETSVSYIFILIAIILIFGALGGWVSYLLNEQEPTNNSAGNNSANPNGNKGRWGSWIKPVIIGIAAAFLVPLFLQTISSQLLRDGYSNYLYLLVFAGFCLVAAISSKAFITTLSDKILQVAKEAKKEAREAKNEAEQAKENSVDAQGTAASARNVAFGANSLQPIVPLNNSTTEKVSLDSNPEAEKESLIKEYNEVRETMDSGWARTAEMSRIFRRMINVMPEFPDLPVLEYLNEKENLGKRLFGYAYFFYQPKRELLPQLIESVSKIEIKPFAQYWGILAIGKVLSEKSETLIDSAIIQELREFLLKLSPGTDRWKELKNILAAQEKK
mgnify:CR=1 FL=1